MRNHQHCLKLALGSNGRPCGRCLWSLATSSERELFDSFPASAPPSQSPTLGQQVTNRVQASPLRLPPPRLPCHHATPPPTLTNRVQTTPSCTACHLGVLAGQQPPVDGRREGGEYTDAELERRQKLPMQRSGRHGAARELAGQQPPAEGAWGDDTHLKG